MGLYEEQLGRELSRTANPGEEGRARVAERVSPFFDDEPTVADTDDDLAARMRDALGAEDAAPGSVPPDHVSWLEAETPLDLALFASTHEAVGPPSFVTGHVLAANGGIADFDVEDPPTLEAAADEERYLGSIDALCRVEVLPDGTLVASGSSLENAAVIVEPLPDGRPSPAEAALLPFLRAFIKKVGARRALALLGQADRLNETAAGEARPVLRRHAIPG